MSQHKMKSLLKGLRYISHIFENEQKEPEMQIGNPTDVKHVAHIGWDGGAVNSPSWMNGFKTNGAFSSAALGDIKEDASCVSQESTRSRDMPGLPRTSRNRSSNLGSPTKSERSSRRDGNSRSSRKPKESSDAAPTDGTRRSRRKKSKESANGGSSRSSRRARESHNNDSMSETGSVVSITNDI